MSLVTYLLKEHTCFYCGAIDIKMTLDRIDNSIGHTRVNVNPSCVRCNGVRGNMPYAAWMAIVPAIKKAREDGLFGSWVGRVFAIKPTYDDIEESKQKGYIVY